MGARTEHLRIGRAQAGSGMGTVQRIEHLGDQNHIHLAVGDHTLVTLENPMSELHTGDRIDMMKVGGASGPLYGSLLMGIGKSLAGGSQAEVPRPSAIADALQAGVDMVRQRGRSDVGDKTMLDVLVPVCEALRDGASQSLPTPQMLDSLSDAAGRGLESTRSIQARKGRASFLGERSIGHLDPGARSSQLIVDTVCASLRGES